MHRQSLSVFDWLKANGRTFTPFIATIPPHPLPVPTCHPHNPDLALKLIEVVNLARQDDAIVGLMELLGEEPEETSERYD